MIKTIEKTFEKTIDLAIYVVAKDMMEELLEEKRQNAVLTIQKAFREYRYNPKHKFCKLVQMRNMLNDGLISKEQFEKYIRENKINFK